MTAPAYQRTEGGRKRRCAAGSRDHQFWDYQSASPLLEQPPLHGAAAPTRDDDLFLSFINSSSVQSIAHIFATFRVDLISRYLNLRKTTPSEEPALDCKSSVSHDGAMRFESYGAEGDISQRHSVGYSLGTCQATCLCGMNVAVGTKCLQNNGRKDTCI